ncbi:MAG TPA: hypothetical protein VJ327_00030 [Patescibacteria group bacterium]|nr:hypothetical protein [Patescibacteria group bacterium]
MSDGRNGTADRPYYCPWCGGLYIVFRIRVGKGEATGNLAKSSRSIQQDEGVVCSHGDWDVWIGMENVSSTFQASFASERSLLHDDGVPAIV